MTHPAIPFFDGHNDTAQHLREYFDALHTTTRGPDPQGNADARPAPNLATPTVASVASIASIASIASVASIASIAPIAPIAPIASIASIAVDESVHPIDFLTHNSTGHLDLPRARLGHLQGGIFALFARSPQTPAIHIHRNASSYRVPLAAPLPPAQAARSIAAQLAGLQAMLARAQSQAASLAPAPSLSAHSSNSPGPRISPVQLCTTAAQLEHCFATNTFAILLHMEGAEAITLPIAGSAADPRAATHTQLDTYTLEALYDQGLRSLGLVWSRPNAFGHGVPFAFPHSPNVGPGLTPSGRELVRICNRLGVLIDCAHLNQAGFFDVAALTHAPLVVSHTCAHALTPTARNLTNSQLDAIRDSDGLVGVNLAVHDLRADGKHSPNVPLARVAEHFAYLVDRLGEDRVALGSDFDGATIPSAIGDASGLQHLIAALRTAGFSTSTLHKLARNNWLRILRQTLHPA